MDLFEYSEKNSPAKQEEKNGSQETVFTVSEVTYEIKHLIAAHFQSKGQFWIKGEISGYKGKNQAGHIYFTLKDENAVLKCVFFKFSNLKSKVELKEGASVFARGKIDVWEKGGNYQLIVDEIKIDGAGDLHLKFEQLKKKLQEEGLFLPEHKKPLPKIPATIGIVTSPTGAVIRDIIHVVRNRFPLVKLLVFPVKVQGEGAAEEIVLAINRAQQMGNIDVLIVGRGGGSIEDLWPFNEEKVARAIFACNIPIVSAVGHQTDFTIADFVADVRAATPSQAAEMIIPSLTELRLSMEQVMKHIIREVSMRKNVQREKLFRFLKAPVLVNPRNLVYQKMQRFDFAFETFLDIAKRYKQTQKENLSHLYDRFLQKLSEGVKRSRMLHEKAQSNLELVNPKSVLSRGFSIVEKANQQIVRSSDQVEVKESVTVHLHQGKLICQVLKN